MLWFYTFICIVWVCHVTQIEVCFCVNNANPILACAVLSGVFTDVESSLKEIRDVLEGDEASERALQEAGGPAAGDVHLAAQGQALAEIRRDLEKYMEAHEKASFTNTELHRAMNLHISNLRLLGGPLESLREALPRPQLSEGEGLCDDRMNFFQA